MRQKFLGDLTLFRMGLFTDGGGGGKKKKKKAPLSKSCHIHPTMMKLGRVTLYLKKTQKIYESRDKPLEFC